MKPTEMRDFSLCLGRSEMIQPDLSWQDFSYFNGSIG